MEYHFIICDDDPNYTQLYRHIIDSFMIKNKLQYKKHIYHDYNQTFENVIEAPFTNRIYLLDVETKSGDGMSMATKIRKVDKRSYIIFITGFYNYYLEQIASGLYNSLTILNKRNKDLEYQLEQALKTATEESIDNEVLALKYQSTDYHLTLRDIKMIEFLERKSIVYLEMGEIPFGKNLNYFETKLNSMTDHFVKVSKSAIVNVQQISKIDERNLIIYFKKSSLTTFVSKKYLVNVLEKWKKIDHIHDIITQ